MPSAAARRLYEDQIPSFMSVFDIETDALEQGAVTVADTKIIGMGDTQLSGFPTQQLHPTAATLPTDATHRHQDSTSTQNSESADSSPTTAGYGTDTASFSDPSPSSSPDSPINLVPLSSFPGPTFGPLPPLSILSVSEPQLERPVTSPSPRRPRNMKGLSIQPPFAPSQSPSLVSEPSSPVFIKPAIPAMKRKPSQLSLKTSTSDLIKASTTLDVPQSPSLPPILQRRALKHSTSSPHMLSSLKSATFGPAGGMTIPPVLERNESGLSSFLRPQKPKAPTGFDTTILEEESPIRTQIANRAAYDFEPYHEIENNEDQKTPGYPDGPIAIYSDNVYLYLEPTADEAAKFDVVINVAREVTNPFKARASSPSDHSDDIAMSADNSPIPDTALTGMSFATAFEYPPGDATPTTPKPCFPLNEPEYIHMPWEHNTDISTDLMSLCETIEKKTKEGKKVLIHCQQGASRSASLIIAYGMYQNPELSVNDAYHAAQAKSRWISPNMRLMYCLQDFQKDVSRRKLTPLSGFRPRSGRSPTKLHRAALSVDAIPIPPKEPLTAPLPSEDEIGVARSTSPERQSPSRPRRNSTPGRDPISPGPSSAPSSFSWRDDMSDGPKSAHFETDKLFNRNSQPDSGFASSSSLEPYSNARPPPSPAFPPSNPFGSFALPPSSPGFAPMTFGSLVQPPTPQKAPPVGLAPLSFGSFALSNPPKSPGFAPSSMGFSKPPPSPGFGAHRFGGSSVPKDSFGFAPLQVGPPPLRALKKKASAPAITTIPPPLPSSTLATNNGEHKIAVMQSFPEDPCLMSPRVETMTNNPLHDPFANMTGMRFVEVPPTPSDGLFSPRETMFPRDPFYPFARPMQITDPRSPPTKGETPIVRSIDELI